MMDFWAWLFEPDNSPVVGAISLIIGVVGFPLTLIQLWRTKRAADAAKDAADNAKLRITSFSAMRECEHARTRARAVNDAIAAGNWEDALVKYQEVSVSFMHLCQSNVNFDPEVSKGLSDGIKTIDNNCSVLERALKSNRNNITKGKQFSALRPIDEAIAKTLFNLERLSS